MWKKKSPHEFFKCLHLKKQLPISIFPQTFPKTLVATGELGLSGSSRRNCDFRKRAECGGSSPINGGQDSYQEPAAAGGGARERGGGGTGPTFPPSPCLPGVSCSPPTAWFVLGCVFSTDRAPGVFRESHETRETQRGWHRDDPGGRQARKWLSCVLSNTGGGVYLQTLGPCHSALDNMGQQLLNSVI